MKLLVTKLLLLSLLVALFVQCEKRDASRFDLRTDDGNSEQDTLVAVDSQAVVTNVTFSGQENNYTFQVTIESPDLGCNQYADWWEVFTPDSTLIYRRILAHSHVNEQPFTRSGGTVKISASQQIYVRAHMNNLGYGSLVFSGTVVEGLSPDTIAVNFAQGLRNVEPLPTNCAF